MICTKATKRTSQKNTFELRGNIKMDTTTTKSSVKVIGANGQISLGKQFAGRQVLLEERELGVWTVRLAVVIPENEMWLHQPQTASDLRRALDWAQNNPAQASDVDALAAKRAHDDAD
jgi:hypothetical protein